MDSPDAWHSHLSEGSRRPPHIHQLQPVDSTASSWDRQGAWRLSAPRLGSPNWHVQLGPGWRPRPAWPRPSGCGGTLLWPPVRLGDPPARAQTKTWEDGTKAPPRGDAEDASPDDPSSIPPRLFDVLRLPRDLNLEENVSKSTHSRRFYSTCTKNLSNALGCILVAAYSKARCHLLPELVGTRDSAK